MEQLNTITVDGVAHEVAKFSDSVKKLVAIRAEWMKSLKDEKLAVAKTETAVKALDADLTKLVAAELASDANAQASQDANEQPNITEDAA